ncbi:hypothetical protein OG739_32130 [Streptomyces longwoodensis]|uniref:CATRA system-associated protein n=1 Tax=Streptomyces longwoodensis TaxID=68231 RepID=UPI0022507A74|nr:CATRA system-associated protein [Streptomyces longwoodensis]MCX4997348.1 hypothetical protein [Streptomyces longwoodensis]WRY91978.1 hypothetical protein OG481_27275 [Streptomyces longwoodensis]WUC56503.1 hypothetical protein OHA09_05070 [Streptomyces longwoodensis]WUC70033.1 hypothetical protein OG416_04055 [Streptomyces longwoodensis]
MQSRADSPGTDMDAALRTRAGVLLGDVLTWRLPTTAWGRPTAAVEALGRAYAAGDALGVRAAVSRLEVLSPHRVERIADPADTPPPQPLEEQVTALVHLIGEPDRAPAAEAGPDDGRR